MKLNIKELIKDIMFICVYEKTIDKNNIKITKKLATYKIEIKESVFYCNGSNIEEVIFSIYNNLSSPGRGNLLNYIRENINYYIYEDFVESLFNFEVLLKNRIMF